MTKEVQSVKNWPIKTEIPVLWGDNDSFGHVNNIIYLKWCETSRVELFRKIWNIEKSDVTTYFCTLIAVRYNFDIIIF